MKLFARMTMLAASVLAGMAPAFAADLKLANFMPPTHPYEAAVFGAFANAVSEATRGEVTVSVYSGGLLGQGGVEQYNRAVDGVADIVFSLPGYTASVFPKTLLAELPGVITVEHGTEALLGAVDHLADEYRRVQLVGIWTNSPNLLFLRNREVNSIEDLRGLNIRVPSRNAGLVVESWGASPVSMGAPDIYNAMQTGVLDGAFIDGTAADTFRLSEVTQYIVTGMDSSISSFFMVMNRNSFDALTDEQRAAVLAAGRDASVAANQVQLAVTESALKNFASQPGKQIIELSAEAAAAFNAASAPVVERVIAEADAAGIEARAFIETLGSH